MRRFTVIDGKKNLLAQGVEFEDGRVSARENGTIFSIKPYNNINELMRYLKSIYKSPMLVHWVDKE